jgi:type VI secretion system protein ImpJ
MSASRVSAVNFGCLSHEIVLVSGSIAMKFLSRVVWTEGMYLGPHHFQTQSRYFEDSIAFVVANLWHEPWGLLHFALDEESISNGNLALLHASGVFPDGLAFDLPNSDPPPPVRNLTDAFPPTHSALNLFLAVPTRQDTGNDYAADGNSSTGGASGPRFTGMRRMMRDETNGLDEQEVELGRKNLRLLTEAEITREMSTLPIARVLRDGRGHMIFDPTFVPACLRVNASEPLMLLVNRLLDTIQDKCSSISRTGRGRGRFEAGQSALDVANYWFLHAMYTALPPLRHLCGTKHAHPEEVFCELARVAGALCTFSLESSPAELPKYNHRDPGPVFVHLDQHIRRHLEIIIPSNTLVLDFHSAAPYIQEAAITDERCLRRARWILGVRSSLGESDLMRLAPQLVKICSSRFVVELVKRALPGMSLKHLSVPPAALNAQPDMQYFALDLAGPCWEHILQTKTVGIYIPGEIIDAEFALSVILGASEAESS